MHAWEGKPIADVASLTAKRDPLRYPVGCATGNDRAEIIQWFRSVPELAQFLQRMEPQRWGWQGGALIALKAQLRPALTPVDVIGPSQAARRAYNDIVAPYYAIHWWGSFSELLLARETWAQQLVANARRGVSADADTPACVLEYLRGRSAGSSKLPPTSA